MRPLVSVITCTRNRAAFLRPCFASVRAQTYSNWEMIIADDGSTDGTAQVAAAMAAEDSRVVYLRTGAPKYTIAEASNWALRQARGEYIAILDDDDVWSDPDKLQKQVNFLATNPEYIGCGGGLIFTDEHRTETGRLLQPETDEEIRRVALLSNPIPNSAAMFRAQLAREAGGYDETLRQFADWDFWLKMGTKGKLYNFPEYFLYYTQWEGSSSFSRIRESARTGPSIVRRYRGDYPNYAFAISCAKIYWLYAHIPGWIRRRIGSALSRVKRRISGGRIQPRLTERVQGR